VLFVGDGGLWNVVYGAGVGLSGMGAEGGFGGGGGVGVV